jgi:hypothetical protein
VFWVRGRKWEVFDIKITDEGIQVTPTQEFGEALGMFTVGEGDEPAPEGE